MEAMDVATLLRDLLLARSLEAAAKRFLIELCRSPGISQGYCYWREPVGDRLLPVADHGGPEGVLPDISLEEMDNPLVYGLMSNKACHVEQLGHLVGFGAGFDALRERHAVRDAMLVLPISGRGRQGALGVVVVVGSDAALRLWHQDGVWQELFRCQELVIERLRELHGETSQGHRERVADQRREVERGNARASRLLAGGFIGVGASAKKLRTEMLRLADSSLSLLITGETGSGKDHAAWLVHQASARQGNFVPVNCAAIPKDLIEAELFGASRGAYTGAVQARKGLVAEADGGTLFLDEIGDMPLGLQGTLLRLLNEKKFRPVGATREQASDFRLICATHRPLSELILEGSFREDLYFRIRQLTLHIPPLRERPEDIPALVAHVLLQHNRESRSSVAGISATALARLQAYAFPGNVRELRSLVLAAAERTAAGKHIRSTLLDELVDNHAANLRSARRSVTAVLHDLVQTDNLPEALSTIERLIVTDRLRKVDGSRRNAALSLGIPKRTLARKCLEWNLDGEDSKA
ncbi:sigma-54-dependent Fis family transcriptional regulator [Pseudomonas sp. BN417]|uniref:sigma-54 dependent transcriptional regulator n=1 Tax=Pseudomonas sp. BN417 TaxID=2567890 RepID=UPI00245644BB|nr:sigma-54 dependent transcriptional regulator [Pseudomonas sp. BN417]MDH4556047.1 sigma-54-dependent Fis family transcriptional regulator [Pseudomonas sp. BN417]